MRRWNQTAWSDGRRRSAIELVGMPVPGTGSEQRRRPTFSFGHLRQKFSAAPLWIVTGWGPIMATVRARRMMSGLRVPLERNHISHCAGGVSADATEFDLQQQRRSEP